MLFCYSRPAPLDTEKPIIPTELTKPYLLKLPKFFGLEREAKYLEDRQLPGSCHQQPHLLVLVQALQHKNSTVMLGY